MKTSHTQEEVRQFLQTTEHATLSSIEQFENGNVSQALGFETVDGQKLVIRIAPQNRDFLNDQYAYQTFGSFVPIPRIIDIGHFGKDSFYCIAERMKGVPSNKLNQDQMEPALDKVRDTFAKIFTADISSTSGYGEVDVRTGNAASPTWRSALEGWHARIADTADSTSFESLREHTKNVGLNPELVDRFLQQFDINLKYASEVRRLFHGDPGFDNLLLANGKVSAVLDWAEMGYGDWARDFARLDFWWPNRFGDMESFATEYDLDREHLQERKALYWSVNALATIEYASINKNEMIANWLSEHVVHRILC